MRLTPRDAERRPLPIGHLARAALGRGARARGARGRGLDDGELTGRDAGRRSRACDEARDRLRHVRLSHESLGDGEGARVRGQIPGVLARQRVDHALVLRGEDLGRVGGRRDAIGHAHAVEQPGGASYLVGRDEHGARALTSGAAGAPAPVRVRVGVARRLDVDDARDVLHVDAARGDVGGDEGVEGAALERREGARALGLLHVPREHPAGEAGVL